MKKIIHVVRDILEKRPLFARALGEGIVNFNALARKIQVHVEGEKLEKISVDSIAVALKRLAVELEAQVKNDQSVQPIQGINIRSNIYVVSYERSTEVLAQFQELLGVLEGTDNAFMHLDQGMRDVSFILSEELYPSLKKLMKNKSPISEFADCALVSITLPRSSLDHPGVCSRFFDLLAWHNINLISFFHTYAELTFVVKEEDALRAQSKIMGFIERKK